MIPSQFSTLLPQHDPMGAAILDYQQKGKASRLVVRSSMFDDDVMPVKHLFRSFDEMPAIEQQALQMARGRVLDVGAGAGCHALWLQQQGLRVTSIDISPLSCQAMRQRGLDDVRCVNLFAPVFDEKFDTLLLLMNGTGIAGKLERLPLLLQRLSSLLASGGQILIDSSDLKYIFENEDGTYDFDDLPGYYGEVDYSMSYRGVKGESFDWLYVDYPRLEAAANVCGLQCELVHEGDHYDYLARLTRKL